MKIATKANAAPRLGGPQGLTSWATPERRGAMTRPTAVTDCPTPIRVPLAWAPPTVSWRSVMQVLPMAVEKDRSVEDKTTATMVRAVEKSRSSRKVSMLECSRTLWELCPYSRMRGPRAKPARAPRALL